MMSDSDSDPELAIAIAASLEAYCSSMSKAGPAQDGTLHSEILTSITSGNFIDIRFYLPTRRRRSGIVTGFRPVYANSAIICRQLDDISQMLQSEFSESNLSVFNSHGEFAVGYEVPSEDYGYESDSDLEEDEDDDPTGEKSADGQSEAGKVDTANGGTETVDANGSNEQRDDQGVHTRSSTPNVGPGLSSSGPSTFGSMGRTVVVRGTAYRTWVALVAYLYTGKIAFAPLRSTSRSSCNVPSKGLVTGLPCSCSPKSMYRLADKYGLHALKEQALIEIKTELGSENIVHELTSSFTACYPDIQMHQLELLCTCPRISDIVDSESFKTWIARVAQGEMPRSEDVLLALFRSMAMKMPKE